MFPKPAKGSALLERKERQRAHKAREQAVMQEAKHRDGGKCRVPRCRYQRMDIACDPCHRTHRGMGGNPKEDRTTRDQMITLCRIHHANWDTNGTLEIEPLDAGKGFDGPAAFYEQHGETGRMECIGIETQIGVSVPRQ